MAEYKVIYFPVYGRAESTRMALAHAKANWEDERLTGEQFGPRKAAGEFPNGQLPVLVHNGKYLNESTALLRYVGKHFGYYPADAHAAWQADAFVDYANDFIGKLYPILMIRKDFSEAGQAEFSGHITTLVTFLNKHLEKHGKDFLAGEKLTIADFHVASIVFSYVWNDACPGGKDFTDKAQAIVAANGAFAAWCDRMKHELADHLASRPAAGI